MTRPAVRAHGLWSIGRQALASAQRVRMDSHDGRQGIERSLCRWTLRAEICSEASTACGSPDPPPARRAARCGAGVAPVLWLVRWGVVGGHRRTKPGLLSLRPLMHGTGEKKPGRGRVNAWSLRFCALWLWERADAAADGPTRRVLGAWTSSPGPMPRRRTASSTARLQPVQRGWDHV